MVKKLAAMASVQTSLEHQDAVKLIEITDDLLAPVDNYMQHVSMV